jgi:hypothetical protein
MRPSLRLGPGCPSAAHQFNESSFKIAKHQMEQSLRRRRQQPDPRGDDRERITRRTGQAAEALFTPKQPVSEPSVPASLQPGDRSARKPRVLGISPAPPDRAEERKTPVSCKQQPTPEIPISQLARIRSLVKYGMTVPQVAESYGVAVGAIERILRKA